MKKTITSIAAMGAGALLLLIPAGLALADSIGPITFESPAYTLGVINGQNGWSATGSAGAGCATYDEGVSSSMGVTGFGSQSFRISDAVTSGCFSDQAFAPPLVNPAGEATADNASYGGTIQPHFEAQFDIAAIAGDSDGSFVSISPDRGDGSRMSYLRFEYHSTGINVFFDDVTDPSHAKSADTFNETQIATLDPSVPHTIKFVMDFNSGPDNDVVKIYIDGALKETGTSWEDYYRFDTESNPSAPSDYTRTVRTLLFKEGGTANSADSGKGFLIDNLSLESGPMATPSVTTDPASGETMSDATLNGTDGPVAADNESFWVSTTTINTSSPTIPQGVYSTQVLPGVGAGANFSDTLSSLTAPNGAYVYGQVPGTMPAVTPGTTYYYVAWIEVDGTWYPGQVVSFQTVSAPTPTVTTNSATGETTSGATLNGTDGSVNADNTSFWWGTTPISGLTAGGNVAEFPASNWSHDSGLGPVGAGGSFNESVTGLTPGETYYFVAWVEVGGTWYPGNVLSFVVPTTAGMCPANLVPAASALQTVMVNSGSDTPTPSMTLTNGQSYLLESSGTWQNNTTNVADSMYASLNGWTNYQEGYDSNPYFLGPQEFNLEVNGAFTNWGPYSSAHNYSALITGTGAPANFMVFDGNSNSGPAAFNSGWYGDNTGNLSVAIYQCVAPPTPANACATPKVAPAGYTLKNGSAGNASVTLAPMTMFVGAAGNPKITGPAGNYILCLSNGNATVTLGDGSDVIVVGNGNQSVTVGGTGAGSSNITVGNGNSVIKSTDTGSQTITAGNGNQTITTGSGNDTIKTGAGNSTINAGLGTDSCTVGAGHSTLTSCNP